MRKILFFIQPQDSKISVVRGVLNQELHQNDRYNFLKTQNFLIERLRSKIEEKVKGTLVEPLRSLEHTNVRQAYYMVICRAKTIPWLVGHDGDPAFINLFFQELEAILDICDHTGRRYRSTEQAPVEREHQETQRTMGMLITDVIKCLPGEWAQVLPLLEWIRTNTPTQCGITPRDLDRQWSIASPIDRELLPFEPPKHLTVSEVARTQFTAFQKLREAILQHTYQTGQRRAEIANRVRTDRQPEVGDKVMYGTPPDARSASVTDQAL